MKTKTVIVLLIIAVLTFWALSAYSEDIEQWFVNESMAAKLGTDNTPYTPPQKQTIYPGIKNNNPGNIEDDGTSWQGKIGTDTTSNPPNVYLVFDTMQNGVRALTIDVVNTINAGYNTPVKLMTHYLGGQNANMYASFVAGKLNIGINDNLPTDATSIGLIVNSIISYENGAQAGQIATADIVNGIKAGLA